MYPVTRRGIQLSFIEGRDRNSKRGHEEIGILADFFMRITHTTPNSVVGGGWVEGLLVFVHACIATTGRNRGGGRGTLLNADKM